METKWIKTNCLNDPESSVSDRDEDDEGGPDKDNIGCRERNKTDYKSMGTRVEEGLLTKTELCSASLLKLNNE